MTEIAEQQALLEQKIKESIERKRISK